MSSSFLEVVEFLTFLSSSFNCYFCCSTLACFLKFSICYRICFHSSVLCFTYSCWSTICFSSYLSFFSLFLIFLFLVVFAFLVLFLDVPEFVSIHLFLLVFTVLILLFAFLFAVLVLLFLIMFAPFFFFLLSHFLLKLLAYICFKMWLRIAFNTKCNGSFFTIKNVTLQYKSPSIYCLFDL